MRCPGCHQTIDAIVVYRTDDYEETYRLDRAGEWELTGTVQNDTPAFDQHCGRCDAYLGSYGEIGELDLDEDEGDDDEEEA